MDKTMIIDTISQALTDQPVRLAYIYGSFVTGRVRRGRDIDVAVVAEPDKTIDEAALAVAVQKQLGIDQPEVDLRLIDLNSAPVFLRNILKDGRPILVKNETERIDFEVRAMKNYYDSAYLRDFMTQNMYQQIKEDNYGRRPHYH